MLVTHLEQMNIIHSLICSTNIVEDLLCGIVLDATDKVLNNIDTFTALVEYAVWRRDTYMQNK